MKNRFGFDFNWSFSFLSSSIRSMNTSVIVLYNSLICSSWFTLFSSIFFMISTFFFSKSSIIACACFKFVDMLTISSACNWMNRSMCTLVFSNSANLSDFDSTSVFRFRFSFLIIEPSNSNCLSSWPCFSCLSLISLK